MGTKNKTNEKKAVVKKAVKKAVVKEVVAVKSKKRGRPKQYKGEMVFVQGSIPIAWVKKVKAIGDGVISVGLRKAIAAYKV